MRILIADEEQNVRMNLKRLLEKQGYECVTVASDREMREILESQDFDLVLTEMKLTGHDVIELIKNLRESGLKVPIVVVTAYGTPENIANAMKAGVSDYVSKPFSPEEILSKVESNIRKKDTPDKLLRNFQSFSARFILFVEYQTGTVEFRSHQGIGVFDQHPHAVVAFWS